MKGCIMSEVSRVFAYHVRLVLDNSEFGQVSAREVLLEKYDSDREGGEALKSLVYDMIDRESGIDRKGEGMTMEIIMTAMNYVDWTTLFRDMRDHAMEGMDTCSDCGGVGVIEHGSILLCHACADRERMA